MAPEAVRSRKECEEYRVDFGDGGLLFFLFALFVKLS